MDRQHFAAIPSARNRISNRRHALQRHCQGGRNAVPRALASGKGCLNCLGPHRTIGHATESDPRGRNTAKILFQNRGNTYDSDTSWLHPAHLQKAKLVLLRHLETHRCDDLAGMKAVAFGKEDP